MSIKTSHIGNNWITFLAISIGIHLTLVAVSFSPEALKIIAPEIKQKRTVARPNPFYIDVITLPPGTAGKKITPENITRFANESRSVEVEGSPLPTPSLGNGRGQAPAPRARRQIDLSPRPRKKTSSQSKGDGSTSAEVRSGKASKGGVTGGNKKKQGKAISTATENKATHKRALVKDGVIIIEGAPFESSSASPKDAGNGKGSGDGGARSAGGKAGGSGEIGPPSLFPSRESIAKVIRKNTGGRGGGRSSRGIYMHNRTKQLQINATELKDARYLLDLKRKLDLYWEYPPAAARRGEQGTLRAAFKVKRDGTIFDIKLVKSAGYPTLDDAVINALRLCSPLNPLPDDFKKDVLTVKARFKYILTR